MNFLEWLKSNDPNIDWVEIRNREGLPGIERELVNVIAESGGLNLNEVYNQFFQNDHPWDDVGFPEHPLR